MKSKIIYVVALHSSFVDLDMTILSKRYTVILNSYKWQQKFLMPVFMFRQLGVLLKHAFSTKLIFISSGGNWSLIPVVFGKLFSIPVFIVLNGSDCASLPFVNFGNLRKFLMRNSCRLSYELAGMLLPVSESLVMTKNTYYSKEHPLYQGYKYFFPHVKTKYQVIFNGLDEVFWSKDDNTERENKSFFSVFSPNQYILKGGDLIVAMAKRFPDCNFYIAGLKEPPGLAGLSPNVFFLGFLSPPELRMYFNKCRFHFQLSIYEGFGLTLCEAMLCECIPIGSDVNFIPGIIGDAGFILRHRDEDLLEDLIRQALRCENLSAIGANARQRIIANFGIEKREQQLFSLIDGLEK